MNPRFQTPRSAYVHVPFCRHRCGYCNFTLVAGREDLVEKYLTALGRELALLAGPHPVDTLFVGGGTPTHLSVSSLERLLELVGKHFRLATAAEFTVEANPTDIGPEKLSVLRALGVTRLSLGVQSFDADKLRLLERDHGGRQAEKAIRLAQACFQVSVDLIFGVPGETLATWQRDLDRTIRLAPAHISTYGLTYERGTRFWARRAKGQLQPLNESLELEMYNMAIDRLTCAGWHQYEVSSFARWGQRCRHNQVYWTGGTYFGVGPGAARHVDGRRELNHQSTTTYIRRVLARQSPVADTETLPAEDSARERLAFGLRLVDGVDKIRFRRETGYHAESLLGGHRQALVDRGFLHENQATLRLTRAGLLVSDSICAAAVSPGQAEVCSK